MTTLARSDSVSLPLAVRRFAGHFLEMCVAMCMGGAALSFLVFGAAGLAGYPDLVGRAPALAIAIVALNLTIAMAAYMQLRHHPIRHNVEMSASSIVGGVLMLGAFGLGLIADSKFDHWLALFTFMCGPLCVLMLLVMVARFEHYGGHVGASAGTVAVATGEYTCSMHPEVRRPAPGRCPICGMALEKRT